MLHELIELKASENGDKVLFVLKKAFEDMDCMQDIGEEMENDGLLDLAKTRIYNALGLSSKKQEDPHEVMSMIFSHLPQNILKLFMNREMLITDVALVEVFPSGGTTLGAALNSVLSVADVVNSKQVVRNLDIHSKVLAVHALRYGNNNTKLLYKLSIEKELSIGNTKYRHFSL